MWIARDKDGTLRLFTHKPKRAIYIHASYWEIPEDAIANGNANEMEIHSSKFKKLKWEDDPVKVELTIVK